MEQYVKELIKRAAESQNAETAMKFAQASLNAANAMCSLATSKSLEAEYRKYYGD